MAASHYSYRYNYHRQQEDDDDISYITSRSASSSYYNPIRSLPNRNHETNDDPYSHYGRGSRPSTPVQSSTPVISSSPYYQQHEDVTDLTVTAQFVDLTDYTGLVEERVGYQEEEKQDERDTTSNLNFLLEDKRYTHMHPAIQSRHEKLSIASHDDAQSDDRLSRMRRESELVDLSSVADRVSLANPHNHSFHYIDLTQVPSILDDNDHQSVSSLERDWELIQNQRKRLGVNVTNHDRGDSWEVQSLPQYNLNAASYPYQRYHFNRPTTTTTTTTDNNLAAYSPMSLPARPSYSELPAVTSYGLSRKTAINLVMPNLTEEEDHLPPVMEEPLAAAVPTSPGSHPSVTFRTANLTRELKSQVAQRGDTSSVPSSSLHQDSDTSSTYTNRTEDPPGTLEFKPSLLSIPEGEGSQAVGDPPGQLQFGKLDRLHFGGSHRQQPPGTAIRSNSIDNEDLLDSASIRVVVQPRKSDAPATEDSFAFGARQKDCPAIILRQLSNPAAPSSPASDEYVRHRSQDFAKLIPFTADLEETSHEYHSASSTQQNVDKNRQLYHEIIVVDSRLMETTSSSSSSSSNGRESRDPTEKASNLTRSKQRHDPVPSQAAERGRTIRATPSDPIRTWMPSQANIDSVMRGMGTAVDEEVASDESAAESLLSHLLNDSIYSHPIPSDRVVKDAIAGRDPSAARHGGTQEKERSRKKSASQDPKPATEPDIEVGENDDDSSTSSSLVAQATRTDTAPIFTPKPSSFELNRQETLSDGEVYCDNDDIRPSEELSKEEAAAENDTLELQKSITNDMDETEGEEDDQDRHEEQHPIVRASPSQDRHSGLDAEATYAAFCISDSEHEKESEPEVESVRKQREAVTAVADQARNSKIGSLLNLWEDRFKQKAKESAFCTSWEEETIPSDDNEPATIQGEASPQEMVVVEEEGAGSAGEYTEEEVVEEEEVVVVLGQVPVEDMVSEEDRETHDESVEAQESTSEAASVSSEPEPDSESESETDTGTASEHFEQEPQVESDNDSEPEPDVQSVEDNNEQIQKPLSTKRVWFKADIEEVKLIHPFPEPCPVENTVAAVADVWSTKMAGIADKKSKAEKGKPAQEKEKKSALAALTVNAVADVWSTKMAGIADKERGGDKPQEQVADKTEPAQGPTLKPLDCESISTKEGRVDQGSRSPNREKREQKEKKSAAAASIFSFADVWNSNVTGTTDTNSTSEQKGSPENLEEERVPARPTDTTCNEGDIEDVSSAKVAEGVGTAQNVEALLKETEDSTEIHCGSKSDAPHSANDAAPRTEDVEDKKDEPDSPMDHETEEDLAVDETYHYIGDVEEAAVSNEQTYDVPLLESGKSEDVANTRVLNDEGSDDTEVQVKQQGPAQSAAPEDAKKVEKVVNPFDAFADVWNMKMSKMADAETSPGTLNHCNDTKKGDALILTDTTNTSASGRAHASHVLVTPTTSIDATETEGVSCQDLVPAQENAKLDEGGNNASEGVSAEEVSEANREQENVFSQMSKLGNFLKSSAPQGASNGTTKPEADLKSAEADPLETSTHSWPSFRPDISSFISALSTLQNEKPEAKKDLPLIEIQAANIHEPLSFHDGGSGNLTLPAGCSMTSEDTDGANADRILESGVGEGNYIEPLPLQEEDISELGSEDQFCGNGVATHGVAVTPEAISALRKDAEQNKGSDKASNDLLEDLDDHMDSILAVQDSTSSDSVEEEVEDASPGGEEGELVVQNSTLSDGMEDTTKDTESLVVAQNSSLSDTQDNAGVADTGAVQDLTPEETKVSEPNLVEDAPSAGVVGEAKDSAEEKEELASDTERHSNDVAEETTQMDDAGIGETVQEAASPALLKEKQKTETVVGSSKTEDLPDVELTDSLINLSFDNDSKGSTVSPLHDTAEPQESPGATLDMECLQVLVTALMTHEYGFEFSTPIDVSRFPTYDPATSKYKPLDLGTILRNLINGEYNTILDFQSDVNMAFTFRMKHSKKGTKVYKMAKTLKKKFEKDLLKLLDDLETKLTSG